VDARLTSTLLPAGGMAEMELPAPGENLFLYFVDGSGSFTTSVQEKPVSVYDVVMAKPEAETAVIQAGDAPLNYLSFYLKPFMN
jgi:redox-sensitive bicupin YhaK (pirin superfamily)